MPCYQTAGPGNRFDFSWCECRWRCRDAILCIVLRSKPQFLALFDHLNSLLQPVVVVLVLLDLPDNVAFIALVQPMG